MLLAFLSVLFFFFWSLEKLSLLKIFLWKKRIPGMHLFKSRGHLTNISLHQACDCLIILDNRIKYQIFLS